jgi:dihydropteroate synthase
MPEHQLMDVGEGGERSRSRGTQLMGIVNATPDSFCDVGRFVDPEAAVAHALSLVEAGAAIIDVGGESTRPGSQPIEASEELERILPVVESLSTIGVAISVDTSKASVAAAAIAAGATIVNDVSALTKDPEMAALCAERNVTVVLMDSPPEGRGSGGRRHERVSDRVLAALSSRIEVAIAAGIEEERLWVDPGIGFGKANPQGNLEILGSIGDLASLGRPILVGPSRKSFIGRLDGSPPRERLGGTIAACLIAARNGADVLRVHDVQPIRQALCVAAATADLRF